jgi:hypothetical protein
MAKRLESAALAVEKKKTTAQEKEELHSTRGTAAEMAKQIMMASRKPATDISVRILSTVLLGSSDKLMPSYKKVIRSQMS